MHETALDLVERLIAEGRTTDYIRDALAGKKAGPVPPVIPSPPPASPPTAPPPAAPPPAPPSATAPAGDVEVTYPSRAIPQLINAPFSRLGLTLLPKLGWLLVIGICAMPAIVLSTDTPARYASLPAGLLTWGDITGVIGLSLYAIGLVMATRVKILENLFGGLNRVLVAHAIIGSTALMTVLIHPFFSAGAYYTYGIHVVAHFFIPQLGYIGSAFGIFALVIMITLLVLTLFVKLAYKTWLRTHRWLGLVFLLIGLHVIFTPNQVMSDVAMRWYLYGLLVVGSAAFLYRTLLPDIFVRRFLYTIESAVPKGVGVVEVTLKPVDKAIHFKAGQFVFMAFNNDALAKEWHPFSVSSADSADRLMVDIRSLGAYTETLTRLLPYMVGMTVRVEGAYGRFSFRNYGNVNQIWVAGGIGITPFLSMAQGLGPGPYNIDLYYSVKTQSELIDLETLAQQQSDSPGHVFRVFPFIADKYNTFLSADIIQTNSGDLKGRDFLLCGPPPMMQSIRGQLLKKGVTPQQVHSEEFSF